MADPMPSDKIRLEGMQFYGYHGASAREQDLGQTFIVDLEVERDLSKAGVSDSLADTVDYSALYGSVKDIVEGWNRTLLENVAEAIAARTLSEFSVAAVRVKVTKPDVPIKGSLIAGASVEIYRENKNSGP